MPKCVNYDAYFTGFEKSPKGKGYHTAPLPLGEERIGLDNHVWHVVQFGPKCTKRWKKGLSPKTKYIYPGMQLKLPVMEPDIGLMYPHMNPYEQTSWCSYNFCVVGTNCIEIVKNDLGLPILPMTVVDFINLYRKIHGSIGDKTRQD